MIMNRNHWRNKTFYALWDVKNKEWAEGDGYVPFLYLTKKLALEAMREATHQDENVGVIKVTLYT